jgi:hypothetical protein
MALPENTHSTHLLETFYVRTKFYFMEMWCRDQWDLLEEFALRGRPKVIRLFWSMFSIVRAVDIHYNNWRL